MNKKIFVTGGANGLGLAIVEKHLEYGDTVWVLDIEESSGIVELATKNEKVSFIKCDISKTSNVQAAIGNLATSIGVLDYLYSSAGIHKAEDKNTLRDTNLDNAASMYDVNAVGFLRVVQALLDTLQDGSVIMCVTSEAGSIGENWRDAEYSYCMSKAAENMACAILQKHFKKAELDIRVMCIHPGWVRTRMSWPDAFEKPQHSVAPEESAEKIIGIALDIDNIPKERMYMDYKRNDIKW